MATQSQNQSQNIDPVAHYNWNLPTASDWGITITEQNEDGTPMNITGARYLLTVKNRLQDNDAIAPISKSFTSSAPLTGVVAVGFDAEESENMSDYTDYQTYFYDLKKVQSGVVTTLMAGQMTFHKSATVRTV